MSWGAVSLQTSSSLETLTKADDTDTKIGCCSLGAAVQGWDETAVNGAQLVSLLHGLTSSLSVSPASGA